MNLKSLSFWPHGLTLMIILFVAGTIFSALRLSREKIHLVDRNYYAKELVYQERIDRIERTQALKESIRFSFSVNVDTLFLFYPDFFSPDLLSGTVRLIRPADPTFDRSFQVVPDTNRMQVIPINGFPRGLWNLELEWDYQGKGYFSIWSVVLKEYAGNY